VVRQLPVLQLFPTFSVFTQDGQKNPHTQILFFFFQTSEPNGMVSMPGLMMHLMRAYDALHDPRTL
jgi:hypothetical protein